MRKRPLSDINVTPLVDVMLVLLIIFMITAPLLREGIVMDLPRIKKTTVIKTTEEPVIISIKKNGKIFIGKRHVKEEKLESTIKNILLRTGRRSFIIDAERDTPFERVVKVISILRGMGITQIGISAIPEKRR